MSQHSRACGDSENLAAGLPLCFFIRVTAEFMTLLKTGGWICHIHRTLHSIIKITKSPQCSRVKGKKKKWKFNKQRIWMPLLHLYSNWMDNRKGKHVARKALWGILFHREQDAHTSVLSKDQWKESWAMRLFVWQEQKWTSKIYGFQNGFPPSCVLTLSGTCAGFCCSPAAHAGQGIRFALVIKTFRAWRVQLAL